LRVFLFLAVAVLATACGARRLALPAGPGSPFANFTPILEQASAGCRQVRTLTAELALSGRAGRQQIRGRVLAGFAPGALRLEGAAPFGGPIFIFVARNGVGDLLLPRRREVLRQAPPDEILDALAGISLTPDDLRAALAGCVKAGMDPVSARAYGDDWLVVDLSGGGSIYLRRQNTGAWTIVAGRHAGLEVEYANVAGGGPGRVRVRSAALREPQGRPEPGRGTAAGAGAQVDLDIRLSQVETNVDIDPAAFTIQVPPGTAAISLEELREAGPLGAQ
jgi:hypothetical protein